MAILLTVRGVASLKCPADKQQIDVWDTDLTGFGVRVTPSGRKTWNIRYRINGRLRRFNVGTEEKMTLADARKKGKAGLIDAENGIDPARKKQAKIEERTFGELADEYMKRHAKPADADKKPDEPKDADQPAQDVAASNAGVSTAKSAKAKKRRKGKRGKRSWKEDLRIINAELLRKDRADWKHVKVREITRAMVREVFEAITDRGAPIGANRTLALMSKIFNFALQRDWIDGNPAALIEKNDEESRARVLSDDEIRELWAALGETARTNEAGQQLARLNPTLNDAFRMRFYTAQRGGEVFKMAWEDVDLDSGWWSIPASIAKNKQLHRVPLIPAAVELLRARKAAARPSATWVFENVRPSRKNPQPIEAVRDFGNVASRGKKAAAFLSRGDAHLDSKRARARKRPPFLPGLSFEFQGHDIRRSASTNMTKAGVSRLDVGKVLNHVDRGPRSTKVYDRYEYDREKRAALEVWARRLDAILTSQSSDNVLTFAKGA